MADVGNIEFEQVKGARGGVYYICRAHVHIGSVSHIAEVSSDAIPALQQAIPLLQDELKRIAISYVEQSLEADADVKAIREKL